MTSLTWNLKHGTNEPIHKKKQTHRHRKRTCGCQGGGWLRREGLGFEIGRYKLLYIGWINSNILYTTGNYIQHSMISHDGKEYLYVYNQLTLIYSRDGHNIVNQLHFNYKKEIIKKKIVIYFQKFYVSLSPTTQNPATIPKVVSLPYMTGITFLTGGGNDSPLQYSCLENPMDREA